MGARTKGCMEKLVIIGNGVSGTTVARHVRKLKEDIDICIISSETDHFFSRTALMYIYMGHMTYEHTKPYENEFWGKNRIELKRGYVEQALLNAKQLVLSSGEKINYDYLVFATGSKTNKFGWPGQDLPGVQGLYSYQDLETLEENSVGAKQAVIVGGGLIGIELAEMLLSRKISVTFLVRETHYWGNILSEKEAELVRIHGESHGVDFRFGTELKEIIAGSNGRVKEVITSENECVSCDIVGLCAGVHPNIDLAKHTDLEVERGILVNDYLETSIANVYAVGDCAEIKVNGARNRIEPLWYTGKMQAEHLAKTIVGNRTKYNRGIWFNSAKFFDLEYQTYGQIGAKDPEGVSSFYWISKDGTKCVRIAYRTDNEVVQGVNTFGIRMRQNVWTHWLRAEKSIEYVLSNLKQANFDPEFYQQYEQDIVNEFLNCFPNKTLTLNPIKRFFKRFV